MSKIYKVYAQCVTRVAGRAIIEINPIDLRKEIDNLVSDFFNIANTGFIDEDNDKAYEVIADLLDDYWEKNKILEFGDYEIVETDEFPSRPNMCGFTFNDFSQEEILTALKAK